MSDEKFFAWLDGELGPAEAAEVEARVAADPELQRLAYEHRAFHARLRGAFGDIAAASVPERLQGAVRSLADVIEFADRRQAQRPGRRAPLPQWAAMAATLVVGLIAGSLVGRSGASAPVDVRGGKMYAAASLDRALERQLASARAHDDVRIGLTFRDQSGTICRSFAGSVSSGLACRKGQGWQLRGLFAAPEGQSGDYRMAAGADPNLGALIDSIIAGEPLDAQGEAKARRQGWK